MRKLRLFFRAALLLMREGSRGTMPTYNGLKLTRYRLATFWAIPQANALPPD